MPQHLFESILANLQSGIIVVDRDFRIIMVNNYAVNCCGLPEEQFVGQSLDAISPELHAKVRAGKTADELYAGFCGHEKAIGFNLTDLTDRGGNATGYIINLKDLTEVVKIRNDLRHKERLAAIGEVVGKVAHEMRNPLFGITAAAQILEMELPLAANHKELMDSLMRESRRLNNLVEVLQECTSVIRLSKKRIDLVRLLDEAVRDVDAMLSDKGVLLRKDYGREHWLFADDEKLKRVLINLLRNAVEASAVGGEISLAVVDVEDGITVMVTDQGKGIEPEKLEKIFDVFFTTRKNRSGLGGLSSCRSIAAAHGGGLTAVNPPEGGARFILQLPRGDGPL